MGRFYVPKTITTLIGQLKVMKSTTQKPGLHLRGYGKGGNSACFENGDGSLIVRKNWKTYFGIK